MITDFNYKGIKIYRRNDGYLNGTAMCKTHNKLIADWLRNKETKAYIAEIARTMGIPIVKLVATKPGNPEFGGGTWIHPALAIDLAKWISVEFRVWCDAHIFNLISTGNTSLKDDAIAKMRAELCHIRAEILNETNTWDADEKYYLKW